MRQHRELSVVIPTINNPDGVIHNVHHLSALLLKNDIKSEIILVDDLSQPDLRIKTISKLNEVEIKVPIKLLLLSKRSGQFIATRYGMSACESSYVLTIDDDTLLDEHSLIGMITKIKELQVDFLVGVPAEKTQRNVMRSLGSLIASMVARFVYKTPKLHEFSSTVLFRSEAIVEIAKSDQYPTRAGWFYLLTDLYDNCQITIRDLNRTSNYSLVTLIKNFAVLIRMLGKTSHGILAKMSLLAMVIFSCFAIVFTQSISSAPSGYTSTFLL
jgi:glycosyltransferase involved in cell wall biosynthesis